MNHLTISDPLYTYILPFEVDAEASVRGEEATLHIVEVVVVLEQQGDPVQIPDHNITPFNTPLLGGGGGVGF